jgi:hypothetical protein
MNIKIVLAASAVVLLAACTPDRSLTTDSPYWPGEYRDGYNDGEYVGTLQPTYQPIPPY